MGKRIKWLFDFVRAASYIIIKRSPIILRKTAKAEVDQCNLYWETILKNQEAARKRELESVHPHIEDVINVYHKKIVSGEWQ